MFGYQGIWGGFSWWWIFPIIMMVVCFFMMRGCIGSMMGRHRSSSTDSHGGATSDSALDVLNQRYARGEIKKDEYEEKRKVIGL